MCLPSPISLHAWQLFSRLGRDFNGSPLVSEQEAMLDREGIVSHAERTLYRDLWAAADSGVAQARKDRRSRD